MSLPPSPSERILLTPSEFAATFGRQPTWAYRKIHAGQLRVISKPGGKIMIPRSEMDRLKAETGIFSEK